MRFRPASVFNRLSSPTLIISKLVLAMPMVHARRSRHEVVGTEVKQASIQAAAQARRALQVIFIDRNTSCTSNHSAVLFPGELAAAVPFSRVFALLMHF